jgi:hypothetical protein
MINRYVFLFLSILFYSSCAQMKYNPKNYDIKDWEGVYLGDMYIYSVARPDSPMQVKIQIEILPTDTPKKWTWRTTYFATAEIPEMVKDYHLLQPDSLTKGFYWIDEGNDLLLHHTCLNNVFYNSFSYNDILLQSRTELLWSGQILMEVVSQPMQSVHTFDKEGMLIKSYPTYGIQKAILKRSKRKK